MKDGKMMEIIAKAEVEGVHRHRKQSSSSTSGAARRRAREATMKAASAVKKEAMAIDGAQSNGNGTEQYCRKILPEEGQGHTNEVWALTLSSDGKYLVSGGKDRRICVWSLDSCGTKFVKALGGHKDSITGLRFRTGSHDLFSASSDRTLKLFDVSQLSYVETFFGHQEEVASLDLLRGEVVVSAGARDRTVRWWKVRDESQLVFRGGAKSKVRDVLEGGDLFDEEDDGEGGPRIKRSATQEQLIEGSIDSVAMIDEHTFLSGGDSGTISLWSLSKKKPIFTAPVAHGFHITETETEGKIQTPRWITSLACLPYGDVFASGSWDGRIRLWKINSSLRSFSPLLDVPMEGFINSLQLIMPGRSTLKKQGRIVDETLWRRKNSLDAPSVEEVQQHNEPNEANGNGTISTANGIDQPKEVILLSAGVGQEPSRGRWLRLKHAKNGASIVPLYLK
jgi:ribosomal RNA-processing protein 9